jgi:PAS domain S-box-containing protein
MPKKRAEWAFDEHKPREQLVRELGELRERLSKCRDDEAKHRSLFDSMREGFVSGYLVYSNDFQAVDLQVTEVNPSFEVLTGLSAADLLNHTVCRLVPTLEDTWIENHARVARTGEPLHWEGYTAHTGSWYEVYTYRPAPGMFASVFSNTTERKRTQQYLELSEERLRIAMDAARFGTFDYYPQSGTLVWDDLTKQMWGLSPGEELDYEQAIDRIHPEDREHIRQAVAAWLSPERTGGTGDIFEGSFRVVLPDGTVRWHGAKGCVQFDEQGRAVRMTGVESDITERG